jgi:hypothetical protein
MKFMIVLPHGLLRCKWCTCLGRVCVKEGLREGGGVKLGRGCCVCWFCVVGEGGGGARVCGGGCSCWAWSLYWVRVGVCWGGCGV